MSGVMMTYKFTYERSHFISREANRVGGKITDSMIKIDITPHDCR